MILTIVIDLYIKILVSIFMHIKNEWNSRVYLLIIITNKKRFVSNLRSKRIISKTLKASNAL